MTDDFEQHFGPGTREERAARLDGEAVADPTKHSSAEVELAKLLADTLGYGYSLVKHTRWLLTECGGDYDGLRKTIVAMGHDAGWLSWVYDNSVGIWPVRAMIVEKYKHDAAREKKRRFVDSTEGRRARYVTEGVLS